MRESKERLDARALAANERLVKASTLGSLVLFAVLVFAFAVRAVVYLSVGFGTASALDVSAWWGIPFSIATAQTVGRWWRWLRRPARVAFLEKYADEMEKILAANKKESP